jgi:hypothetical protein
LASRPDFGSGRTRRWTLGANFTGVFVTLDPNRLSSTNNNSRNSCIIIIINNSSLSLFNNNNNNFSSNSLSSAN